MSSDVSEPGTIFALPFDHRHGVGQVVDRCGSAARAFHVVVFDGLHRGNDVETALAGGVVLMALTMDALLFHDTWSIIGHRKPVVPVFNLPAYGEDGESGSRLVVDESGNRLRPARNDVERNLGYRTVVAPIRVQNAFHALHGGREWDDVYDELLPPAHERTVEAVFGKSGKSEMIKNMSLSNEHEVATHLPLSGEDHGTEAERSAVQQLGHRINAELDAIGGEHDGHEFGNGEAVLFSYGPHADQVFDIVRECLSTIEVREGAYAVKRYGPAGDTEARMERVELS